MSPTQAITRAGYMKLRVQSWYRWDTVSRTLLGQFAFESSEKYCCCVVIVVVDLICEGRGHGEADDVAEVLVRPPHPHHQAPRPLANQR